MTLPAPESSPLQPMVRDDMSHALLVLSTFTGGLRFCRVRTWRSCSAPGFQSLIARMVGMSSTRRSRVSMG